MEKYSGRFGNKGCFKPKNLSWKIHLKMPVNKICLTSADEVP